MVTILSHEVLLFEKPRLCKHGILLTCVYFLLFIIKECLCLELSCPNRWMEIPFNCSSNLNQCLVIRHNFSEEICKKSTNRNPKQRTLELRRNKFLNFCNHYNLDKVMSESDKLTHIEGKNCVEFLRNIECQDSLAEMMYNQFVDLLSRMDCQKPYSVRWNCTDCLHSYKMWACSRHLSFYEGDTEIPPCLDVCLNVENRCPFFRPVVVHAGEPSFLCKDSTEVTNDSISSEQCYKACYFGTDPACSLPEIKRETTSNTNISLPLNCCSLHICYLDLWTIVIGLFYLWLVRTFIQYMSIGLT